MFRFFADNRIDFRNLAKKLATKYKTRIELRQIGIRDKAREIGGAIIDIISTGVPSSVLDY